MRSLSAVSSRLVLLCAIHLKQIRFLSKIALYTACVCVCNLRRRHTFLSLNQRQSGDKILSAIMRMVNSWSLVLFADDFIPSCLKLNKWDNEMAWWRETRSDSLKKTKTCYLHLSLSFLAFNFFLRHTHTHTLHTLIFRRKTVNWTEVEWISFCKCLVDFQTPSGAPVYRRKGRKSWTHTHTQNLHSLPYHRFLLYHLPVSPLTPRPPALLSVARCLVWPVQPPSERWWLVTRVLAVPARSSSPGWGGSGRRTAPYWCHLGGLAPPPPPRAAAALCNTSPELLGCSASAVITDRKKVTQCNGRNLQCVDDAH